MSAGTGAIGYFGIYQPSVAPGDYHSLAELSVTCCLSASSQSRQRVEVGWIVDLQQFGDLGPHLFVNAWVNGVSLGYNGSFVLSPNAKHRPEDPLPVGGIPRAFAARSVEGNWWIMYDNAGLGYFASLLWKPVFSQADFEQWFGEVAASTPVPSTEMGNGIQGTQTGSAQIGKMGLYDSTGMRQDAQAGVQTVTNSLLYSVNRLPETTFASFRYGGRGNPPSTVLFAAGGLYATSGKPGAALVFAYDSSETPILWISDGTPAGTLEFAAANVVPFVDANLSVEYFKVVSNPTRAFFWCTATVPAGSTG